MNLEDIFDSLNYEYVDEPIRVPEDIEDDYKIIDIIEKYEFKGYKVIEIVLEEFDTNLEKQIITKLKNKYSPALFITRTEDEEKYKFYNYASKDGKKKLKSIEYNELTNKTKEFQEKLQFFDASEDVVGRLTLQEKVDKAFESDKVTKKFYTEFDNKRKKLLKVIQGIDDENDLEWYASVLLNRLMFIYFLQKKGFLDTNYNYLQDKFKQHSTNYYKEFLQPLFFEGFAKKVEARDETLKEILGDVPYLNGGLFTKHQLESEYENIQVDDSIFKDFFVFFNNYTWHLDDRPLSNENEINADVLGYIFEKYINQKQMGAYYTKEDITNYISKSTIIPAIFDKSKVEIDFLKFDIQNYIFDTVSTKEKLPKESTREYDERQKRYEELKNNELQSINDFITYNLDIEKFIVDYIKDVKDDFTIRKIYNTISKLTIIDPTCGSGAFLFAGLNILIPIYKATLEKLSSFKKSKYSKEFDFIISKVASHPNQDYFIQKSIILHNLYGVDIMHEAVEIAKLRLFLKMISLISDKKDLEPLPDIDFNIISGNTLVGAVSQKDLEAQSSVSLFGNELIGEIDSVRVEIEHFRHQQDILDEFDTDRSTYFKYKNDIQNKLNDINHKINKSFADSYYDTKSLEEYEEKYQPFNWIVNFYSVISSGGFDVIIGNPPYVEYSKIQKDYKVLPHTSIKTLSKDDLKPTAFGYKTFKCGNLYPFVMERSFNILRHSGRFGMIVPLTSISNNNMSDLQYILKQHKKLFISNFEIRPSKLFDGVDQRLSIIMIQNDTNETETYTTNILRWYADNRNNLFKSITYSWGDQTQYPRFLRFSNKIENNLFSKFSAHKEIKEYIANKISIEKDNYISYRTAGMRYWIIFLFKEFDTESVGNKTTLIDIKYNAKVLMAILNSNLFWWYYAISFDMFNNKDYMIFSFRFNYPSNKDIEFKLMKLAEQLEDNMELNKEVSETNSKTKGRVETHIYKKKKSKHIVDEVDKVLAEHYGFTDEELDFIINYDIKYRMGDIE